MGHYQTTPTLKTHKNEREKRVHRTYVNTVWKHKPEGTTSIPKMSERVLLETPSSFCRNRDHLQVTLSIRKHERERGARGHRKYIKSVRKHTTGLTTTRLKISRNMRQSYSVEESVRSCFQATPTVKRQMYERTARGHKDNKQWKHMPKRTTRTPKASKVMGGNPCSDCYLRTVFRSPRQSRNMKVKEWQGSIEPMSRRPGNTSRELQGYLKPPR